jgi:predicted AAA+ superfamily ATPase
VAKTLAVTTQTVANHLLALERANLVYRLPPLEVGGKRALKVRNKYYLVDAALRNAVLLRGEEILENTNELGTIVETTVLRHLNAHYYRDTPTVGYWRDAKTQKEVDIVVRSPRYVFPFEVKYRQDPRLGIDSGLVPAHVLVYLLGQAGSSRDHLDMSSESSKIELSASFFALGAP